MKPLNFSGEVKFRCGLDFNTHYEIGAGWDQTEKGGAPQSGEIINFWTCTRKGAVGDGWAIQARTARSGHQLFSSFRLHSEQPLSPSLVQEEKFIGVDFVLAVQQDVAASVDKVVVNDWARTSDVDAVWARGSELMPAARRRPRSTAHWTEHAAFWKRVWDVLDIEIDGDPDVLQGLRFSSFQTYQSYHGENADLNALCKGLTGEVYFGWVFWDSEIYSHRLMMFIDPAAARNLLLYRYHRLPQALERARQLDCEGARFPFATITGTEDSGTWQHVDLEIHADMAVAYAIWHHDKILPGQGIPVPRRHRDAAADLPVPGQRRRVEPGATGDFGFYGVMGPDEFHMMVNHNCYTNVMGKKAFEFTLGVLAEMQREAPDLYRQAVAKTELKPERARAVEEYGREDADSQGRAHRAFYEQHAGYFDLPHVDLQHFPPDQIPIYKHWAYIKIFRNNIVKQPDVLNLMYFFSQDYTRKRSARTMSSMKPGRFTSRRCRLPCMQFWRRSWGSWRKPTPSSPTARGWTWTTTTATPTRACM